MRQSLCLLFTFAAALALATACTGEAAAEPEGGTSDTNETIVGDAETPTGPSHHVTYYMLSKG